MSTVNPADHGAANPPATPGSSDPAPEQAPIATENQKTITGDPGFGEQQPRNPMANVDMPLASSAPPPGAQSGVPLPEDRAARAADAAAGATPQGSPVVAAAGSAEGSTAGATPEGGTQEPDAGGAPGFTPAQGGAPPIV